MVDATADYVDGFAAVGAADATGPSRGPGAPTAAPTPTGTAAPTSAGTNAPTSTSAAPEGDDTANADTRFQRVLEIARLQIADDGCDLPQVQSLLRDGLAGITTDGPVAAAVLRQLTASMTGAAERAPATREVKAGEDLLEAVAQLPAGSTIDLAPGTFPLDDVLVLLSPITIRAADRKGAILESSVSDFAVLVVADGVVTLDGLTVRHTGKEPANVVLAGPTASLVVTRSTVTGGVARSDGTGGAGILMYDPGTDERADTTTLEVTGSRFLGNAAAGAVLTGGRVASITGSTFSKNSQCGVCFLDHSGGSVEGSTFTDNGVGVAAAGGSAPTVVKSTIRGGEVGVQASETASPVLDEVRISGASRAAMIYSGRAAGVIRSVTCTKVPFGLVVGPQVAPTVTDTTCAVIASTR